MYIYKRSYMNEPSVFSKESAKVIDQGFVPILGASPSVLILGTLPSVKSLEKSQYYGNPQNAFWWMMSQLLGFDLNESYEKRCQLIKAHSIAAWDVIASCHRPGSLDSKIDQSTLKPNDFSSVLGLTSTVRLVAFNGQAACKLFSKYVQIEAHPQLEFITLPSTSPANAAMSKETKKQQWLKIMKYV